MNEGKMLCNELSVYCKTTCTPKGLYYDKPEVDALLAKKDEEIAELKQKLEDVQASAHCDIDEVDCTAAELMQKLDEKDKDIAYWRKEYDQETKLTDALKAEIESLKASHYAESVDAEMRERRLRRALWRAIALFCARSCEYFSGIMSHCLMGQDDLYRRCEEKKNKYLHAMYKCRAKAEEYK